MSEKNQIVFMQARILRLAAEKWNTTIQKANAIFAEYGLLKFIEDCFGIFHTEGDEAVFNDIEIVLKKRGVDVLAEVK